MVGEVLHLHCFVCWFCWVLVLLGSSSSFRGLSFTDDEAHENMFYVFDSIDVCSVSFLFNCVCSVSFLFSGYVLCVLIFIWGFDLCS